MSEIVCPSCGRKLPDDAPAGLCPVCVLTAAHQPAPPVSLPSLGEIRAAFPQFEIIECIGHGGMGVVYKVRHPQLDRLLALKILLPGLHADPGFAVRFEREAKVLAKLDHPNIVAVHDFGQSANFCWLTMTYVEGVNLRQAMQAARFTPQQALAIIPPLCAALQYAHDHGILHRDIKPENILLDAAGGVKVVDFGIARLTGEDPSHPVLTYTGSSLGSAVYAAPEQIEQPHRVDHRADLYSLGVVLYEMLTGELPLGRFPAPSERSAAGPGLDRVVFRTLEKEPDKRYQSAAEVQHGLANAADPAQKPAPGRDRRTRSHVKWRPAASPPLAAVHPPRRRAWPVVLVCLVILTCFAGYSRPVLQGLAGVAALAVVVVGLGSLAGMLVISLHRLWVIRQMRLRRDRLMEILGVYLPTAGMALLVSAHLSSKPYLPFGGRGDILLNVAGVAGICLVVALPLFWLVSPRRELGQKTGPGLRGVSLAVAALSVGVAVMAKRIDGHWPFANYYAELDLSGFSNQLPYTFLGQQEKVGWDSPRDAARKLVYGVSVPGSLFSRRGSGSPWSFDSVGMLTRNEEDWHRYAQALLAGIDRQIPASFAVTTRNLDGIDDDDAELNLGPWMRNAAPPGGKRISLLLYLSAGVALLAAWCMVRARWEPLAVFVVAMGVVAARPVWIRGGDLEDQLMTGPVVFDPRRRIEGVVDQPREAAQVFMDSAWANRPDVFLQILQPDLKQEMKDPERLKAEMKRLSGRAWAVPEGSPVGDRFNALVLLRSGRTLRIPMVHHDDAWYVEKLPQ